MEEVSDVTIATVRFEYCQDALGIGTARPRISWMVNTAVEGWNQAGYELEVYGRNGRLLDQTGRVESDQSVLVPWPFAPLSSREQFSVRVRVWGIDGGLSAWSALAPVEAGLFHAEDWTARFVTPDWEEDISRAQPLPLLRRGFEVRSRVTRARLYITALGVYEAQLNGEVVGNHVLAPGWTSYHHRLRYQTFDVTNLLREGHNALGAILGDGWFRGRLSFAGGRRNIYGNRLALLAQLEIEYADGPAERVVTDETWRAALGPIRASDLYDGETYDARLERPGWSMPGYDDHGWAGVRLLEWNLGTLVAPPGPPVRRIELLEPVAITTSPAGCTIIDFGQNLVGHLRFTVQGTAGQMITLRHAEVLEDGELCTRPLRTARAIDYYTLRGEGVETWEPRFTYHGFRYAEITGWPGELRADDICAVVCHSDLERTGWFECSDPLINRLHDNVVWSMRGNFLDIPTDCPQRDERLGWTGDIQVFAPTATFLFDVAGFLVSWLADLAAEQRERGTVPFIIPDVMSLSSPPAAAWGDAAVIVPWVLYQRCGDTGILAAQFDSMRAWVDLVASIAGDQRLWESGYQFGDWLDPTAPPERPDAANTNPHLVATAYFAWSAELLGRIAGVLGRAEEEARYLALAAEVRDAFHAEYVTTRGRLLSDSATAYALALQFALLRDEAQRRHAGARLASIVRERGYQISTGFVGTPLLCDALCSVGEYDAAFRLLTQRECPSWLYPVTMGATTIWERWDSLRPDGSINPGEMTSFNHYALGAVADWLHRTVAGLAPAAPGYRRLDICPRPGGGLTSARARHRTPYGMAEASWRIEADQITIEAVVPPNTTASVTLPGNEEAPLIVGAGTHRWSYRYQLPEASQPALSLTSPLAEVLEEPEAFRALMGVLHRHLPEAAAVMEAEARIPWNRSRPLHEVLLLTPNAEAVFADLRAALNTLQLQRVQGNGRYEHD